MTNAFITALQKAQDYEIRSINFEEMKIGDRYNPIDYINEKVSDYE